VFDNHKPIAKTLPKLYTSLNTGRCFTATPCFNPWPVPVGLKSLRIGNTGSVPVANTQH
jgi:hypothetical protein